MLESVKARCFVYSGLHCYIEFWALILAVRSRCLTSIHVFTRHCGNLNRINRLPLYLFFTPYILIYIWDRFTIFFFFFTLLLNFYFSHFRTAHFYLYLSVCFYIHISTIVSYFLLYFKHVFYSPRHTFSFHYDIVYRRDIIRFKGNEKYQNNFFLCEERENFSFDALPRTVGR